MGEGDKMIWRIRRILGDAWILITLFLMIAPVAQTIQGIHEIYLLIQIGSYEAPGRMLGLAFFVFVKFVFLWFSLVAGILIATGTGEGALGARDRSVLVRVAMFCVAFLFVFVPGSLGGPFAMAILFGIFLDPLMGLIPQNVQTALMMGWLAICAIVGLYIGSVLAIKNDD
jgi:hypothetical protein